MSGLGFASQALVVLDSRRVVHDPHSQGVFQHLLIVPGVARTLSLVVTPLRHRPR
jgi:hypothetical protein